MERKTAIKKANNFLGKKNQIKVSKTARKIKEKSKKNSDLNRASLNQIVADIYQRGADPKDLDLQRIDFNTSYENIRGQVADLVKKRRGQEASFANERREKRKNMADQAQQYQREMNTELAEQVHNRRSNFSQYVDETRNNSKTFRNPTERQLKKWRRNPGKYDIAGVDTKKEPEARKQATLPFNREGRGKLSVDKYKNEMKARQNEMMENGIGMASIRVEEGKLSPNTSNSSSSSVSISDSNLQDSKDSRSMAEVGRNISNSTSQESLRDGYSAKSSEKTLNNFENSVTESGKSATDYKGNYL
jgi:hypothetical protein